ncbi:unnamed protein product [Soboliphyme baturini]|uniref:Procollagen-proline 3-dioxygenase n=1 Tax=Soboliphyme baturini TaxID=241478 RepID=A0A183IIZ3_9BILA|nr:unnamed protein product [Soboliphyme baturini]
MQASFLTLFCCGVIIPWLSSGLVSAQPEDLALTFDVLYQYGKDAYTGGRWRECVSFFLRALEKYKYYRSELLHCEKKCRHVITSDAMTNRSEPFHDWHFFLGVAQKSLCLLHCRNERFSFQQQAWTRNQVEVEFESYLPYSYMQFCYWQLGDLEHAVSAAYTYLRRNPDSKMMVDNMQFYSLQEKFSSTLLKDLEKHDYEQYYSDGVTSYENEDFISAVELFEQGVESFLRSAQDCMRLCDRCHYASHSNYNSLRIAECFLEVLRCQSNCTYRLSHYEGKHDPALFPSMFNYLQISYWRSGNLRMACEAVGTYLLFFPDDEDMLSNRDLYYQKLRADKSCEFQSLGQSVLMVRFVANEYWTFRCHLTTASAAAGCSVGRLNLDVEAFYEIYSKIDSSLESLREKFFSEIEEDSSLFETNPEFQKPGVAGGASPKLSDKSSSKLSDETGKKNYGQTSSFEDLVRQHGLNVTVLNDDSNEVFGVKNFLSSIECEKILSVKELGEDQKNLKENFGDSTMENFRFLNITAAAQMALHGELPRDPVDIILKKRKFLQFLVESYYQITNLKVESTMMVCRTSKPETDYSQYNGKLLFSDANCVFEVNTGTCSKSSAASFRRHYNAFIFLNDHVSGGQLALTDTDDHPSEEIASACGKLVVLPGQSLYAWRPLNADSQCILAFFFTKDPAFEEKTFGKVSVEWETSFAKGHVEHVDL